MSRSRPARGSGLQLSLKESQLAWIADDMDGLNDLAAYGEHENPGEFPAEKPSSAGCPWAGSETSVAGCPQ
jgi:hypothetical protein